MKRAPLIAIAAALLAILLLFPSAHAQDVATYYLDQSVINIDTLGDVKLIRTAQTPRDVKIIKAREYQASTCTAFTTHEYTGTCYERALIPNPRVCGLFETYRTYGPFGSVYVGRRCVYWVGGGFTSAAQPYSCPATREVCSRTEMEMRIGTIEFDFEFRRMHRLGAGEVEEYLLTEQYASGRSTWDFRILDSNSRTYEVRRDGTTFELRRN